MKVLPGLALIFTKPPVFLQTKRTAVLSRACSMNCRDTPGSHRAAKCLTDTRNRAHNSSACGAGSSALKPSTFQPATSPVLLIHSEWRPSQRGRCCRQKFSLWLWITFQQPIPLSLTNEGRLFLGHGRRFPCWHYPVVNCPSPGINLNNKVEQAILFIPHLSRMSLRREIHSSVFLLLS